MARDLSVYTVLQDKIYEDFFTIEDPDTHVFSDFFVEATTVLASYGDQNQQKMATLCARALLSWTPEKQQNFLMTINVPGIVHMQMIDPSEWPLQPVTSTMPNLTPPEPYI
ncbi:hypothetical protein STASHLEY_00250 [Brevundimonas phage vB_BpoS-StAshley]|nr:hypothetical protein STASHLEY_00250 [Brevundimonas phage vB_BpoS-StAshley]UTC30108.1 hypothetical protein MAINES_00690 [Brevundimonas phage vB_BpoS-MaInes]